MASTAATTSLHNVLQATGAAAHIMQLQQMTPLHKLTNQPRSWYGIPVTDSRYGLSPPKWGFIYFVCVALEEGRFAGAPLFNADLR
jgi:hypothetical protein